MATVAAVLIVDGPAFLITFLPGSSALAEHLPAILFGVKGLVASLVNMQTFAGIATQLLASILAGSVTFLAVAHFLRAGEIRLLKDMLRIPSRTPFSKDHVYLTHE